MMILILFLASLFQTNCQEEQLKDLTLCTDLNPPLSCEQNSVKSTDTLPSDPILNDTPSKINEINGVYAELEKQVVLIRLRTNAEIEKRISLGLNVALISVLVCLFYLLPDRRRGRA